MGGGVSDSGLVAFDRKGMRYSRIIQARIVQEGSGRKEGG
jgi:hypothetical protein